MQMADKDDLDDEDILLAAAVAVMAAGIACVDAVRSQLPPAVPSSGAAADSSPSSSSSSWSTGRTGSSRKRSRNTVDRIDNLSSQIGKTIEAIKSRREDFTLVLYEEVMKASGYDEVSLGRAFDYLLEHENHARAFLAKNDILRQAWLSDFFSSNRRID